MQTANYAENMQRILSTDMSWNNNLTWIYKYLYRTYIFYVFFVILWLCDYYCYQEILTKGSSPRRDIRRKVCRSPCFMKGRITIGIGNLCCGRLWRLTPVRKIHKSCDLLLANGIVRQVKLIHCNDSISFSNDWDLSIYIWHGHKFVNTWQGVNCHASNETFHFILEHVFEDLSTGELVYSSQHCSVGLDTHVCSSIPALAINVFMDLALCARVLLCWTMFWTLLKGKTS